MKKPIILFKFSLVILCTMFLGSCMKGKSSYEVKNYSSNIGSVNPIKIAGVSLDQNRQEIKSTLTNNLGCNFNDGGDTKGGSNECCIELQVRSYGSKYCDAIYFSAFVGGFHDGSRGQIILSCEMYSGCQYTSKEVAALLSKRHNLKFPRDGQAYEFRESCAVSDLGEAICLSYDRRMKYNGGLGPRIRMDSHKYKRSINL